MKNLFYCLIIVVLSSCVANKNSQPQTINISGTLTGCQKLDTIRLYEHDGATLQIKASAPIVKTNGTGGTYSFQLGAMKKGFYFVGSGARNVKPLILGPEANVTVNGACTSMGRATVQNSAVNDEYVSAMTTLQGIQQEHSQIVNEYRKIQIGGNASALETRMATLDKRKVSFLDSLKKSNEFVSKVVALQTYLNYQTNKGKYTSEMDYFSNEYFRFVDLKDPDYNQIPSLFDACKAYAQTLSSSNTMPAEAQQIAIDKILKQIPENTRASKAALGGFVFGFMKRNDVNFVHYTKPYLAKYRQDNVNLSLKLEHEVNLAEKLGIGAVAPDFEEKTPEGKLKKLSDLRGKVVLLDFWASWCKPCRRENPNVVALYKKYQSKGFDVFGVSLDKQDTRWKKAIEADELTWHHVSDLKGWSSKPAQLYGVTGIPQTFLLDKDGKIIAKNLRGEQLVKKLGELLD